MALRPDLDMKELIAKMSAPKGKQSLSNFLRKAVSISHPSRSDCCRRRPRHPALSLASLSPADLASLINAVPIELTGVAPIARAISTAGGIAFDELDADFMLRRLPGVFAAGEMLDWEAPTGGYLLQASFATGAAAGRGALKWLDRNIVGVRAKRSESTIDSRRILMVGTALARLAILRMTVTAASPAPRPAACR